MIDINLKFMENLTTCNSLDVILFTLGVSIFIMGGSYTGYYAGKIISSFFKSNISVENTFLSSIELKNSVELLIQRIKIDSADISKCIEFAEIQSDFDPMLKTLEKLMASPDLLTSDLLKELKEVSELLQVHKKIIVKCVFLLTHWEQFKNSPDEEYNIQLVGVKSFETFKKIKQKVIVINNLLHINSENIPSFEVEVTTENSSSSNLLESNYTQNDVFFNLLNSSLFQNFCIFFFFTIHFLILTNKILIFYPSAFYSFIKMKKFFKKKVFKKF
jgi:hypothetical protein